MDKTGRLLSAWRLLSAQLRFRFFLLACIAGVLFRSRNRHVEFQKLRGIEVNANLEGCFFYFPNPFLYEHVSMRFSRIFLDKRSKMQSR